MIRSTQIGGFLKYGFFQFDSVISDEIKLSPKIEFQQQFEQVQLQTTLEVIDFNVALQKAPNVFSSTPNLKLLLFFIVQCDLNENCLLDWNHNIKIYCARFENSKAAKTTIPIQVEKSFSISDWNELNQIEKFYNDLIMTEFKKYQHSK